MATALSGVRDLCRVAARKARKTSLSSEKLFVSIAGEDSEVFGTVTDEVYRMRDFLKQRGVTTVAMEATGVYWLYAYAVLEAAGLAVIM